MITRLLVCTLSVLLLSSVDPLLAQKAGSPQADTVHFREIIEALPNGTQFAYELGGIGLVQPGSVRYIRMTGEREPGKFIQSAPITITSSSDSIRFVRWVNFYEGKRWALSHIADSATEGFTGWIEGEGFKSNEGYNPSLDYFPKDGSVLYIIELRRVSDNALLASIDTVKAFKGKKEKLRWRHFLGGGSVSRVSVGAFAGETAYLTLRREDHLPQTSIFKPVEYHIYDFQAPMISFEERDVYMGSMVYYKKSER